MPKHILGFIVLLLFCSACGLEQPIEPLPPSPLSRVCPGQTEDLAITEFDPPLQMVLQWDSLGEFAYGRIDLDLDGDGIPESWLSAHDLSDSLTGNPYGYPAVYLRTDAPNLKMGQTSVFFPIGMGQSGEQRYATQYHLGECLASKGSFSDPPKSNYPLWFTCPATFCPPSSVWEAATTDEVYLGFLMNDRLAGWIQLDWADALRPAVIGHGTYLP